MLAALCEHVGIEYDPAMLTWAKGPRASDGVWGQYWYENVWASTGFEPYRIKQIDYSTNLQHIVEKALPIYDRLYEHRLKPR